MVTRPLIIIMFVLPLLTVATNVYAQDETEHTFTIDAKTGVTNYRQTIILSFRSDSYLYTVRGFDEQDLRNFKAYDFEGNRFSLTTEYNKAERSMLIRVRFGTSKPEGFRFAIEYDMLNAYDSLGQVGYRFRWSHFTSGTLGYAVVSTVRLPTNFVVVSVQVSPGSQYTLANEGGVPVIRIRGFVTPNQAVSYDIRFQEPQPVTTSIMSPTRATTSLGQSISTSPPNLMGGVLPIDTTTLGVIVLVVVLGIVGALVSRRRKGKGVGPTKPVQATIPKPQEPGPVTPSDSLLTHPPKPQPPSVTPAISPEVKEIEEKIAKLEDLRTKGRVDERVYERLRKEYEQKLSEAKAAKQE